MRLTVHQRTILIFLSETDAANTLEIADMIGLDTRHAASEVCNRLVKRKLLSVAVSSIKEVGTGPNYQNLYSITDEGRAALDYVPSARTAAAKEAHLKHDLKRAQLDSEMYAHICPMKLRVCKIRGITPLELEADLARGMVG